MNGKKIYFKMSFLALIVGLLAPISLYGTNTSIVANAQSTNTPQCTNPDTPATVPSLFTTFPNAAYACGSTIQGVEGPDTQYQYYNADWSPAGQTTLGNHGTVSTDKNGALLPSNSCSLLDPGSYFTNCIWIPLMQWIGQLWLTIGSAFLTLGGLFFDTLINGVIINFTGSLNNLGVTAKITTGWDLFRDLSNILIIGMFVFIAISTILGSKEYGYKKLVARVLIIAVLMNFSLLFTKLIIDASNFTAYQFYNQMAGTGTTNTTQGAAQFDVAQAFLKPMGITTIWDNKTKLTAGVVQNAITNGNNAIIAGLQAFLFGLIGGILLLIIGAILFYGAFLIGARAVVLVILMLTASVAFATYLIPNFAGSKYGWKGWWEALINCAVFAPLLMLFLSLSVLILQTTNTGGSTLGGIISDPVDLIKTAGAWNIILIYILGVGLLFVSLKISSQFASSISGINLAVMIPGAAFATINRSVIAPIARQTVGRKAANDSAKTEKQIEIHRARLADTTDPGERKAITDKMIALQKQKARYDGMAKGSFNVMDTGLGKTFAKVAGLKGATAGETPKEKKGGFAKGVEERAKIAEELSKGFTLSKKDRERIGDADVAKTKATEMNEQERKNRADAVAAATTNLEEVRRTAGAPQQNAAGTPGPIPQQTAAAPGATPQATAAPGATPQQNIPEPVKQAQAVRNEAMAGMDEAQKDLVKAIQEETAAQKQAQETGEKDPALKAAEGIAKKTESDVKTEQDNSKTAYNSVASNLEREIRTAEEADNQKEADDKRIELVTKRANHEKELKAQDKRIEDARAVVKGMQTEIDRPATAAVRARKLAEDKLRDAKASADKAEKELAAATDKAQKEFTAAIDNNPAVQAAQKQLKDAEASLKEFNAGFNKKVDQDAKNIAQASLAQAEAAMAAARSEVARRQTGIVGRTLGDTKLVQHEVEHRFTDKNKNESFRKFLNKAIEDGKAPDVGGGASGGH